MVGIAAIMAVAAPVMVADERGMFHVPQTLEAFRTQHIERAASESEWPFAAASGHLVCAWVMRQRTVYFVQETGEGGGDEPATIIVSTNPFDLMVVNIGQNAQFSPYDDLGQLIRRLAPFEALGRRLCDQPRGTGIGSAEL